MVCFLGTHQYFCIVWERMCVLKRDVSPWHGYGARRGRVFVNKKRETYVPECSRW